MTQFIDLCLSNSQSTTYPINPQEIYNYYQFQKFIQYQDFTRSQTSISDCLHQVQQIECYQKFIPFSNSQFWNYRLMLLIKHMSHQICTQIKILSPKGDVLKVISQYHRTHLYRRFLQKETSITAKIHPQTGQISLCNSFLYHKIDQFEIYQNIVQNLFTSITEHEDKIVQIINLVQNKQQNVSLFANKQNKSNIPAFVRLCSKKSNKQNRIPFQQQEQQYFQKRKQHKSRTYAGKETINTKAQASKAKQLTKYLNNPLQSIDQIWQYDNLNMNSSLFKRQVKNILGNVQNSLIRKDTPLKNYQLVKLPQRNLQNIMSQIQLMKQKRKSKQITKIQRSGLGKVTVQIHVQRISIVQRTYKFLSALPPQFQLSFVNNYFSCKDLLQRHQTKNVIIQLAIRRQQLLSYLQSNSQCISFSTKLRILSQLISSAYLLENKCSTMMTNVGMNNFSIAKNMMLKLNHLQYLRHLSEEQKNEFENQIKIGFVQNQVNISRIYSKLFYQKELIYFKPSKNANRLRLSHIFSNSKFQQKQIVIDKIYEQCGFYGPKKLMTLLTCIFIPYIPMVSFEQIKKDPPCKNLKYGIASLIKILQNIQ